MYILYINILIYYTCIYCIIYIVYICNIYIYINYIYIYVHIYMKFAKDCPDK